MAPSITVFCSNRGGIGKSSLTSQLAPAVALAAPDRPVLLVDLSIQGDATTFLLGGVAEPVDATSGARTRGGEVLASLPREKSAAAFLEALLESATAPAPVAARPSFWRGTPAPAAPTRAPIDWKAHAIAPRELHPGGMCPPNLFLLPGGKSLFGAPFDSLAPLLRDALTAQDAIVLVDTDAELSERGASLAGIACADRLALVLSTSWSDYLRTLDDPANSLMEALGFLKTKHPALSPRIAYAVFNNVQKRLSTPGGTAAVPGMLPFTPPSSSLESLADIATHLRTVGAVHARFFAKPESLDSNDAFLRDYVTGMPTVPESAWQASLSKGLPIVCSPAPTEQAAQAAQHLLAVAAKISIV